MASAASKSEAADDELTCMLMATIGASVRSDSADLQQDPRGSFECSTSALLSIAPRQASVSSVHRRVASGEGVIGLTLTFPRGNATDVCSATTRVVSVLPHTGMFPKGIALIVGAQTSPPRGVPTQRSRVRTRCCRLCADQRITSRKAGCCVSVLPWPCSG